MEIKARITADGIYIGNLEVVTLECGSSISTSKFKYSWIFKLLKVPIPIAFQAIDGIRGAISSTEFEGINGK